MLVLLDQIQNSEQLLQNLQATVSQTQHRTQEQIVSRGVPGRAGKTRCRGWVRGMEGGWLGGWDPWWGSLVRGIQSLCSPHPLLQADLASSHKRLSYEVQRLNEENEGLRGSRPTPTPAEEPPLPSSVQVPQGLRPDIQGVGGL